MQMQNTTESSAEQDADSPRRGCLHESQDTPADASLLRALASDVEEPGAYVFVDITASRLRKLADRLDQPAMQTLMHVADEIEKDPAHTHEVMFVFVEECTSSQCVDLHAGLTLLTALSESVK